MKLSHKYLHGFTLVAALALGACGGGGGGSKDPDPGILNVTVTDADSPAAIEGARIQVTDGGTGDPISVLTTNAEGKASMESTINRSVLLRVSAQGYSSSPATLDQTPLPFEILLDQTTSASIKLAKLANADTLGWITGKVTDTDTTSGIGNALVTSTGGADSSATSSDNSGSFVIFNAPAGTNTLNAWKAGKAFNKNIPAHVTAGAETSGINISATGDATGIVEGSVEIVAAGDVATKEVDVTLTDPDTNAPIPGLQVFTVSRAYTMSGVPDGTYNAIASLTTDLLVLDPNDVMTNGVPEVTVTGGIANPDPLKFKVTAAINFISPLDNPDAPLNQPLIAKWAKHSGIASSDDFVPILVDESGNVLHGGFDNLGQPVVTVDAKTEVQQDESGTFWTYSFDISSLDVGRQYQVRVVAISDSTAPLGFVADSATEDLEGVFTVVAAQ